MLGVHQSWVHQMIEELPVLNCSTCKGLDCLGKGWAGSLVVLPSHTARLLFYVPTLKKKFDPNPCEFSMASLVYALMEV